MKKKNWFWLGISIIILLSIGIVCWHAVNGRNSYPANTNQVGQVMDHSDSTPTIYLHGWGASGKSTDSMIAYAEKHNNAHQVLTAKVKRDGTIILRGTWPKGIAHPIIQLVFADNKNGNYYLTREWFYHLIVLLQKKYRIKHYNTVAHSMGNLTTMFYQVKYGSNSKLPKLRKQVNLGGHFDGIVGMDDKINHNYLLSSGRPKYLNASYRYLLKYRQNYPSGVQVLNVFGNKGDGTNSDGDVSVVSARSLRYLLRGKVSSYREIEVKGAGGQHSQLHENPKVDQAIGRFLW
ncbi:alpha/beta hydrolase [Lactobacillus sp. ESL0731]|uniref:alpha/beta hydrolase n=1 Tax=unclassified Lactobacillus TaxID=2620435 RepID=UPI0023F733F2|nr:MULTISPECIES: alpha/beta hydrolase [unclassified Lactobacillus]WEV50726.1 alpha/beta hydrolase [Lactobacillus sp. ESL0700]WEV61857.1 alpha/beta hydrolase [Lactobacillus sp. ESL0731]